MRRSRLTMVAGVLAVGALALAGCQAEPGGGDGDTGGENTGGNEETDGGDGGGEGLTIGIKYDQPGLGFKDGDTFTGFDVDVATYVAEKLGYSADQITFVEAQSANRETMLENEQVDMIFATYSITDTRDEVVDFAGPYFVAGQDLLIRSEDAGDITGPESLDGRNLCSVSGSTSAQRVKDEYAEGTQLVEVGGYSECILQLIQGTVDAVTTDDIILAGLAADEGSGALQVVGAPFSEENYGVGLPPGSPLCEDVNAAIQEMFDDGAWEAAVEANTEGTGYTPNADLNPPTLRECEA
ncbi:glutamate ABC transporter substrate-binding protein [Pseudactinotalea terrae]|uniref:glutamate ABC transporter substrate-binding protein n=1 Tax=Pseudactinotalea terrae TaxID=1743262 RepID=UPI0012E18673|nr:glutamate ABC transporter substrate-binding protein [Pseudactinotalea terrae]